MDLLREYDFDALPLIDREYDHPEIREAVNDLITNEMRTFTPPDYLAYLPYPSVKFDKSSLLQSELQRVQSSGEASRLKIDTKRYMVEPPESGLENDAQAWKAAVSNAKAQLGQQSNRLLNAEVTLEYAAPMWLQHNAMLQQLNERVSSSTDELQKEIRSINRARQQMQEEIYPELQKLRYKASTALQKKYLCQQAYHQVAQQIIDSSSSNHKNSNSSSSSSSVPIGVDVQSLTSEEAIAAAMQALKEQREAVVDMHDASHNSTVREYQIINTSDSSATADGGAATATADVAMDQVEVQVEVEESGRARKKQRS